MNEIARRPRATSSGDVEDEWKDCSGHGFERTESLARRTPLQGVKPQVAVLGSSRSVVGLPVARLGSSLSTPWLRRQGPRFGSHRHQELELAHRGAAPWACSRLMPVKAPCAGLAADP